MEVARDNLPKDNFLIKIKRSWLTFRDIISQLNKAIK